MYPRTYYETFIRYEANNEVFVAIPFSTTFAQALDRIMIPAIRAVAVNGKPLTERVVNRNTAGAADIHEQIFDGLIHSRLVIADMTVQASHVGDDGKTRWQPNANVAYEVGLAAAWRNPEDILLVHQAPAEHTYTFDVQNLRHVSYDLMNASASADTLRDEILSALRRSHFIAQRSFASLAGSLTPAAAHFMHSEVVRCFPVASFSDRHGMGLPDMRTEAITDLQRIGALKARNSLANDKSLSIIYEWTELGFRLMRQWHILSAEREAEMRAQAASIPEGAIPPQPLLEIPGATQPVPAQDGVAEGGV